MTLRVSETSEQLMFTQVDRTAKTKATILAGAIGVPSQHALGSLIGFWDLCGETREIERIISETPEGEAPAIKLTREDVILKFRLASSKEVEPTILAAIGLLEPLPCGKFRVRGMSRYIEPIQRRLEYRRRASRGGLASAKTRATKPQMTDEKGKFTKAQKADSVDVSTEQQPNNSRSDDRTRVRSEVRSDDRTRVQLNDQNNRSETEVRGKRLEVIYNKNLPEKPGWSELVKKLFDVFEAQRGVKPKPNERDFKKLKELREKYSDDEIGSLWSRALQSKFPSVATIFELSLYHQHFVGSGAGADVRRGVTRAEDSSWESYPEGYDASAF